MLCKNCGIEVTGENKSCGSCGFIFPYVMVVSEMTFTQSIASCFNKYFVFEGKASRAEFWWFSLFCVLVTIATSLLTQEFISHKDNQNLIKLIVDAILLFPQIAVGARRLHDIGKSGWNQLWSFTIVGNIPLIIWWATKGTVRPYHEKINFNFIESFLSFYYWITFFAFTLFLGCFGYLWILHKVDIEPSKTLTCVVFLLLAIISYLSLGSLSKKSHSADGEYVRFKKLRPYPFFLQLIFELMLTIPIYWGILIYQDLVFQDGPESLKLSGLMIFRQIFVVISIITIAKSFYSLINTESAKIKAKTMWFLIDLVILSIIYLYIFKD